MSDDAAKQPVVVLRAETSVTDGIAVQRKLIGAARAFADLLKATLGPQGLDKMLYKSDGRTAVTNDGAKIVAELMVNHPAAKAFQSLAAAQESVCGDGVTSALLFCGELLVESERLLRIGLHPSVVVTGHRTALQATLSAFTDLEVPLPSPSATIQTSQSSRSPSLLDVARTALSGRAAATAHEHCAQLVAEALATVVPRPHPTGPSDRPSDRTGTARAEDVLMHMAGTGDLSESRLVRGVVMRRRLVMDRMPTSLEDVRVAVIGVPLAPREMSHDAEIEVTNADVLGAFIDADREIRDRLAATLLASGAKAFFCKGEVDRDVQHLLIDAGCFVAGELDDAELRHLAAATGAHMVGAPSALTAADLGRAGRIVTRRRPATERVEDEIEVADCPSPGVVTIIVNGSNETTVEEVVRGLHDALRATAQAERDGNVLAGAGAAHASLALVVRDAAEHQPGRTRLAVEAFARALEVIPATLIENTGGDAVDGILELRSAVAAAAEPDTSTDEGGAGDPIGVRQNGEIGTVNGIWHASSTIMHGLEVACDTACSLLRIDQVISARGD